MVVLQTSLFTRAEQCARPSKAESTMNDTAQRGKGIRHAVSGRLDGPYGKASEVIPASIPKTWGTAGLVQ